MKIFYSLFLLWMSYFPKQKVTLIFLHHFYFLCVLTFSFLVKQDLDTLAYLSKSWQDDISHN